MTLHFAYLKCWNLIVWTFKVLKNKQRRDNYVPTEYLKSLKKSLCIAEIELNWFSRNTVLHEIFSHSNNRDDTAIDKSWSIIWQCFFLKILTMRLPYTPHPVPPPPVLLASMTGAKNKNKNKNRGVSFPFCHHLSQPHPFLWLACESSQIISLVPLSFLNSRPHVGWNRSYRTSKLLLAFAIFHSKEKMTGFQLHPRKDKAESRPLWQSWARAGQGLELSIGEGFEESWKRYE